MPFHFFGWWHKNVLDRRRATVPVAIDRRGKKRMTADQAQDVLDIAVEDFNRTVMGILSNNRGHKK